MKWYHALGLTTAFAIGSAECNKYEEVKVNSEISEIKQLSERPILTSGDFMANKLYENLQSDNLEKVCHVATWGTRVRYSELMHDASLSFTPGCFRVIPYEDITNNMIANIFSGGKT